MKAAARSVSVMLALVFATTATAKNSYYSTWQDLYPSSLSGDNVVTATGKICQLCHSDQSGGDGFNGYGWDIRIEKQTLSLTDAILAIEGLDSDGAATNNLDEINNDAQPGWTDGPNNTIYFKTADPLPDQLPPDIPTLDPGSCTDGDGDTYNVDGGACGAVDCDDSDASVNPGAIEVCDDGKDNDCDDLLDCEDSDCTDDPACLGCTDADVDSYSVDGGGCGAIDCDDGDASINPGAAEVCTDGIDNDCDQNVDCDDPNCDGDPACPSCAKEGKGRTCSDNLDNDCDGATDCDDPDCAGAKACKSGGGGTEGKGKTCSDVKDNDNDGLIDCADPDCSRNRSCR